MGDFEAVKKNSRRHKRVKFHMRTEIRGVDDKERVKCATFDLSEGGLRIITDSRLKSKKYEIVMGRKKFNAKVVHEERKESSLMGSVVYYYGMQFIKPITSETKNQLMAIAQSQFSD